MRAVVWAMCALPPSEENHEPFRTLARQLAKQDIGLRLFVHHEDASASGSLVTELWPWRVSDMLAADTPSQPLDYANAIEIARLEEAWGYLPMLREGDRWSVEGRIEKASAMLWSRMRSERVCAVLPWGATLPLARLLQRLAQQSGAPLWILERGPFDGTFDISPAGQGPFCAAPIEPAFRRETDDLQNLPSRISAIRDRYMRPGSSRRYTSKNRQPSQDFIEILKAAAGPKVLFLGSHDPGAGITLASAGVGERLDSFANTSRQAAQIVADALKSRHPDVLLLSKPHPAALFAPPASQDLRVIDAEGVDVHWLLEASDVVVSLLTTTQWHALLAGKPQVVLAPGPLLGRNIAYEAFEPEAFAPQFSRALMRENHEERMARGQALLVRMFDSQWFAVEEDTPCTLRLEDLAEMLAAFAPMAARA